MSIITRCKCCKMKIKAPGEPCPKCGSSEQLFYADYWPDGRNGNRVQTPISVSNIDDARDIEREMRAAALEARKPGLIKQSMAAMTVDDLWTDYISWYKDNFLSKLSLKDVESVYENHLKDHFGPVPVLAVNDHHFTGYQHIRKAASTVKNRTINKEVDYFRGFLTWCRRKKKMAVRQIEYEPLPAHRPLPIILSPQELVDIIVAAEPFYAAYFLLIYSMGLRKGTARGIKVKDVDFANDQVRIQQKGGSYKLLPLNVWATMALHYLISLLDAKSPEELQEMYVLASKRTGGNPVQNFRPAILRACKKAGITKHVYSHLFRHSFATHMMDADLNIRKIQNLLGHADPKATDMYTHVSIGHLRGIAGKFFPEISTDKMRDLLIYDADSLRQDA